MFLTTIDSSRETEIFSSYFYDSSQAHNKFPGGRITELKARRFIVMNWLRIPDRVIVKFLTNALPLGICFKVDLLSTLVDAKRNHLQNKKLWKLNNNRSVIWIKVTV